MDVEKKTVGLEIQVTGVQKDVSYLKEKVDKLDIKLDKMDVKNDKLITDLPGVFKQIMENYVTKDEFRSFHDVVIASMKEHEGFEKDITSLKTNNKILAAIGSAIILLLSFGETIAKWLTSLAHQP